MDALPAQADKTTNFFVIRENKQTRTLPVRSNSARRAHKATEGQIIQTKLNKCIPCAINQPKPLGLPFIVQAQSNLTIVSIDNQRYALWLSR